MEKDKEFSPDVIVDKVTDMLDEVADKVDLNKIASSVQDVLDKTDLDEEITEKGIDLLNHLLGEEKK